MRQVMKPSYDDILKADSTRGAIIRHTPLSYSPFFSIQTGSEIYLKEEYKQKTGSFKIRGAHHKIQSLSDEQKVAGVVAASAGNHAQGVAYAATAEKIHCTIVMPKTASPAKVAATMSYGAEVILYGASYDEAWKKAREIADTTKAVIIHAFDDEKIIAAQGVIGLEILQDLPDVDEIYVPIGGGGLAAGVLIAIKEKNPSVRVIGVQSEAFPSMVESLKHKSPHTIEPSRTIADGISVKCPGVLTFEIISKLVDDVVVVSDADLIKAIFYLMERSKSVVEPAGAASLAYLLAKKPSPNKKVVAVIGGGNIDMYLLSQVVDKGLAANSRLLKITVILNDRPGMFKNIVDAITESNINIVEVIHDRLSSGIRVGSAGVTLSLETQGPENAKKLLERLRNLDVQFDVLT